MTDNHMSGAELKYLVKYEQLRILKFGANLLKDFSDLESLKSLNTLISLDLGANPICEKEGYKDKVFDLFPALEVLDGFNKAGEEVFSEEEDEDYDEEDPEGGNSGAEGEEGEEMGEDDLDEEDYDDEEEGEYDEEDDQQGGLGKRADREGDSEDEAPNKRQK